MIVAVEPSPLPPAFDAFQAAAWLRDPAESSALAGILSFSANGHVREIAVRALARFEDGAELPFLLLRCNDWVDPVASLARQACVARLHAGYELHFAERFLLVAKLRRRIRRNHDAFVRLVENFLLLSEAGQRAALSVLAGKDRHLRRAVAEIIRRGYPAKALPSSVTRQLLSDAEPIMRA